MSDIVMIGGLFEGCLLMLWWIGRTREHRRHQLLSSAQQREIMALRHALSEMAMERHRAQETRRHA
jgi:hypothetical protein